MILGRLCNKHELRQTSGDGEGQGGLACCDSWGHKASDMTGRLNDNNRAGSSPTWVPGGIGPVCQWYPAFLAPGTGFIEDSFSLKQEVWGWFHDESATLHLLGACSVGRSCLTLGDPVDCSSPGSSVHGIFQEYWSG